ncbi:hypothetical protein HUO13_33175 [Saccharopolyspora erythraea]|uniref:hypothetical protein n=1 Tax=Saccharopolyspora erythraea TaxID=1836 RepID=UPI001BA56FE7|nr:hypothetical protein [Saccharopolyspora erythraea]QUH04990.1 hypothetical protein HUO13_33175 [Saccharopolyspora erythraea]
MNAAARLGGFALVAAFAFVSAFTVGRTVNPDGITPPPPPAQHQQDTGHDEHGSETGR